MDNKKMRHGITIMWAMIFCINLVIALWTPNASFLSWILVGFPLGMLLMSLINNPLMNIQDKLIDLFKKGRKHYSEIIERLVKENSELKPILSKPKIRTRTRTMTKKQSIKCPYMKK